MGFLAAEQVSLWILLMKVRKLWFMREEKLKLADCDIDQTISLDEG